MLQLNIDNVEWYVKAQQTLKQYLGVDVELDGGDLVVTGGTTYPTEADFIKAVDDSNGTLLLQDPASVSCNLNDGCYYFIAIVQDTEDETVFDETMYCLDFPTNTLHMM